jgi:hypothetical protein
MVYVANYPSKYCTKKPRGIGYYMQYNIILQRALCIIVFLTASFRLLITLSVRHNAVTASINGYCSYIKSESQTTFIHR